jgi:hypothetical protein
MAAGPNIAYKKLCDASKSDGSAPLHVEMVVARPASILSRSPQKAGASQSKSIQNARLIRDGAIQKL